LGDQLADHAGAGARLGHQLALVGGVLLLPLLGAADGARTLVRLLHPLLDADGAHLRRARVHRGRLGRLLVFGLVLLVFFVLGAGTKRECRGRGARQQGDTETLPDHAFSFVTNTPILAGTGNSPAGWIGKPLRGPTDPTMPNPGKVVKQI